MEADEIRVVLARASELHAKISDAIERALKSEFLQSTGGRGAADSNFALKFGSGEGNGFENFERGVFGKGAGGGGGGDGNVEARTLGLIRDALETLEEQLEALQSMQNHQRAEKDAVLAELEESRHLLLLKLKNHRGSEWEVVQEALAFAGEPVDERDDLLLPPYPRPVGDVSVAGDGQSPKCFSRTISLSRGRAAKRFGLSEENVKLDEAVHRNKDVSQGAKAKQDYQEQGTAPEHKVEVDGEGGIDFMGGIMRGFTGKFGSALAHAAKAVLVVASVVAFLAFTEHSHRQVEQKPRAVPSAVKPVYLPESRPRPPSPPKCSLDKKLIVLEDGNAKCVVKERFELPFPREVKDPDVLYGRG